MTVRITLFRLDRSRNADLLSCDGCCISWTRLAHTPFLAINSQAAAKKLTYQTAGTESAAPEGLCAESNGAVPLCDRQISWKLPTLRTWRRSSIIRVRPIVPLLWENLRGYEQSRCKEMSGPILIPPLASSVHLIQSSCDSTLSRSAIFGNVRIRMNWSECVH